MSSSLWRFPAFRGVLVISIALLVACAQTQAPPPAARTGADAAPEPLVGAWRGKVQFETGAFAAVKDLEFMYTFNAGGTMNESSNYDGSPPVPPAYGVWRKLAAGQYEAKYAFFSTKPPKGFEDIAAGGGWAPAGSGVLVEKITMAADGASYTSTITYEAFDAAGKPAEGGSTGTTQVTRIGF
jgi:hypothetical protein